MKLWNGAMLSRFAIFAALVCCISPAPAGAEPLNLADPTPRTIQVEFEVSFPPLSVGETYSVAFDATYSATGNTGTVVIAGAEYEWAIQTHDLDYFDVLMSWSIIGGSATDFVLDIDLTTLEATAQPFGYQVTITAPLPFPQVGTVSRDLSTTTTAGFGTSPMLPGFPFFCDTCILVPGAPYDPITGKINAVGSDTIVSADINLIGFSRAGDLRLSEGAAPAVLPLTTYWLSGLAVVLAGIALVTIRREGRYARSAD